MKLKVTSDPFPSHRNPTPDLLRQIRGMNVSDIPATIKLHTSKQWRWCRITQIDNSTGFFWVEGMESGRQECLCIHDVEEMLLFDDARLFYERIRCIRRLTKQYGKEEAKRLLEQASGPARIGHSLTKEQVDRNIAEMDVHLADTGVTNDFGNRPSADTSFLRQPIKHDDEPPPAA